MIYSAKELVKEFWENKKGEYQNKYSGITEEQVVEICYNPFKFVSQIIKSGLFQKIRYTYLGVFYVPIYLAKRYTKALDSGHIQQEKVDRDRPNVERYIKNYGEDQEISIVE